MGISSSNVARVALGAMAMILIGGGGEATARPGDRALERVGYRVLAVPEIVEHHDGRLITEALTWQLRAVYQDDRGRLSLARAVSPRGREVRDQRVRLRRPAQIGDRVRQGVIHRRWGTAREEFDRWRAQPSARGFEDAGDLEFFREPPEGDPPPHRVPPVQDPPSCEQALLKAGHHPNLLSLCRGAEPRCASALLAKGHHPNHLNACRGDLPSRCTSALLRAGHHPNLLSQCRGVDGLCAKTLLAQGHHPNHLASCRR